MRRIAIFDTTLRDGEQSPGASMNLEEKLEVARQLARLGVDVIEAGFPIASPGDFEAVRLIAERIEGPAIAGLCRALPADIDRAGEALRPGKRTRIHTFIATSDIHLEHKLRRTREQVLEMAVAGVQRARNFTDDIEFSAEDASRSDPDYLARVVEAVIDAGATVVNIPDTVGFAVPHEFSALIRRLREQVPNIGRAVISVHCHNDLGLAVANSMAAVLAGAGQVECTVNGLGERAGNAALEEVVMALNTRRDCFQATTGINTREIYRSSRLLTDVTGIAVQPNKAVVGSNAFAHEAGIHQHGVLQERTTYEIMNARDVGIAESRLVLGKHSGRHAFEQRLRELGYELSREDLDRAFARFKELADKKKEIFDADLESIVTDEVYSGPEEYVLDYMTVVAGLEGYPTATIKIRHGQSDLVDAGLGVGTIDAVYKTIDKIVQVPHDLVEYSVQSVTGGTDALAEVTVKIGAGSRIYTGRGASLDVVEASAKAYMQAINKLVYYQTQRT
ncbi:MAG: 2-isopropylmalate synthase [Armatimonadetes bacterium]|nr:2-isopropylmalate synthase [Armatimonadota bacterium]